MHVFFAKPFEGVNGSGKHNNWSLSTDTGENLLNPGKEPENNLTFLTMLMATIAAVDNYADLMRISVASAGNDHRLGANEAPPAIVSMYVGDELERVLEAIETDTAFSATAKKTMDIGAHVLPTFSQDNTDRNRTSPFAFTGNKFEFRMPGSSLSIADPNIILNTAFADALDDIYDKVKEFIGKPEFETRLRATLKDLLKEHRRIIFNGNGYSDAWVKEAEKRGLYNLKSLPEALPYLVADKNMKLFEKHHIFTETEIRSRYEVYLENYSKTIHIEALTMSEMVKKDFTTGLIAYENAVATEAARKNAVLKESVSKLEEKILKELDGYSEKIGTGVEKLEKDLKKVEKITDSLELAKSYHDVILKDMDDLRKPVDAAEAMIPETYLPYPTYSKLLFASR